MVEHEYIRGLVVPPLIEDSPNMISVRQHTWGVTKSFRENSILKTQKLIDCIGVTAYDPHTKTAGLLHMDGRSGLRYRDARLGPYSDVWMMLKAMNQNGAGIENNDLLETHIIWNANVPPGLVYITGAVLVNDFDIQKVVIFAGDNVAIDSKDGQIYRLNSYYSEKPNDKRYSRILRMSHHFPAFKTTDERTLGITKFPYL